MNTVAEHSRMSYVGASGGIRNDNPLYEVELEAVPFSATVR